MTLNIRSLNDLFQRDSFYFRTLVFLQYNGTRWNRREYSQCVLHGERLDDTRKHSEKEAHCWCIVWSRIDTLGTETMTR